MTTINLHQNQQQNEQASMMLMRNNGIIFSLLLIILTLLSLFGLKFYVSSFGEKNIALDSEIALKSSKIVGLQSLVEVIDTQTRLDSIKKNLQLENGKPTRDEITKVIDKLGGDLSSKSIVSGFKYADTGKINITVESVNYAEAANQILNFKKSENFSDVNVVSISRLDNSISYNVEMTIKKAALKS